ncbi:MAG: M15 family metallopeptidase [Deltaproteobacteria bacterium]|nr:M15 family metallopeptidase [Deltaproteobacteria bacterium]
MKAYKAGKSQLDGANFKSNHNLTPAMAVDIYCYKGKFADYDKKKMTYMAGLFKSVADDLFNRAIIEHNIIWGGDWRDLVDMPHYELK